MRAVACHLSHYLLVVCFSACSFTAFFRFSSGRRRWLSSRLFNWNQSFSQFFSIALKFCHIFRMRYSQLRSAGGSFENCASCPGHAQNAGNNGSSRHSLRKEAQHARKPKSAQKSFDIPFEKSRLFLLLFIFNLLYAFFDLLQYILVHDLEHILYNLRRSLYCPPDRSRKSSFCYHAGKHFRGKNSLNISRTGQINILPFQLFYKFIDRHRKFIALRFRVKLAFLRLKFSFRLFR